MGLFGPGGFFPSIGNFVGDIFTGGAFSNADSQRRANEQTASSALQMMAFQERMSNTAWQRGVADMRRAGLNPALAFTQGPASAPSGASSTFGSERQGDKGAAIGTMAKDVIGLTNQTRSVDSQVALNNASTEVAKINADKFTANAQEARENIANIQAQAKKNAEEAKRSKIAREVEQEQARAQKRTAKADAAMAYPDAVLDRIKAWIPFTRSSAKTYNTNYHYGKD